MRDVGRRRSLLVTALAATILEYRGPKPAVLASVERWLGNWNGIGLIAAGMHRHGFDLTLAQHDERGWRATFYVTGLEHGIAGGTGWAQTPWRAVQLGAWDALTNPDRRARDWTEVDETPR